MSILVLGDLILDEYWNGKASRLSPEAPVPVIRDIIKSCKAGGAANVALNIKSMGSTTKLISQVSDDTDTSMLGDLDRQLISCQVTPHKIRMLADNHVICRIDNEQYQYVIADKSWITADVSTCVLSDYNKGFLYDSCKIIQWCNDKNMRTIVDPKTSWKHYAGCWLLKANAKELADHTGREHEIAELPKICAEISNKYDIPNLVITLGPLGLFVYTPHSSSMISSEQGLVADVTGAGDVVVAALAHYTDLGMDVITAAEKANKLASISVCHQGSYVVTAADLATVEDKVVFTNGCFDVLHRGHIDYLVKSKQLGSKLVVGINSDRSVKELKGSGRPINSQEDRKAMLESLGCVDQVIIFDEPTPRELILKIKPDIITKGGDYSVDQVVGNDLVNQVIIIPLVEGYSTTGILKRLGNQ